MTSIVEPAANHLGLPTAEWIRHQVEAEPSWFQKIEVLPDVINMREQMLLDETATE